MIMGYTWGALFASYALLLGYVSRDVKRRGMSAGLWMLVCVVLPGGIGAVVYFMLRQPIMSALPQLLYSPLRTPIASARNASSRWRPCAAFAIAVCRITDVYLHAVWTRRCRRQCARQRLRAYSD